MNGQRQLKHRKTTSPAKEKSRFSREFELKSKAFGAPLLPIVLLITYFINEIVYKLATKEPLSSPYTAYYFFLAVPFALFITVICSFFKKSKINFVILLVINVFFSLYFSTQLIYSKFFGYLMTFTDVGNAEQVFNKDFIVSIFKGIFTNFFYILIFFIPTALVIIFRKSFLRPVKTTFAAKIVLAALALLVQSVTVGALLGHKMSEDDVGDKYFYKESYLQDMVCDRFGMLTTARLDLKYTFGAVPADSDNDNPAYVPGTQPDYSSGSVSEPEENEVLHDTASPEYDKIDYDVSPILVDEAKYTEITQKGTKLETAVENLELYSVKDGSNITLHAFLLLKNGTHQKVEVEIPEGYKGDVSTLGFKYAFNVIDKNTIEYGYNVMDAINFNELIANESNKSIKEMHEYFASVPATKKNKYTGLFEGKNIVTLCCESFSHVVIDKERTPTLYKMYTEGFVFENFYVTEWAASTGGGEFSMNTGLAALRSAALGGHCMEVSARKGTYLPFTLGNIMKQYGYTAKSFHNNDNNMYEREKAHALWGYDYSWINHGLEVPKLSGFESDNDMIINSFDSYKDSTPFVANYMTISGHGAYNMGWNTIAKRNKHLVENLDYCDPIKVYLAQSMELEYAVASLLQMLEEEGIADDTVIIMAPDHWPYTLVPDYGVSKSELDKLYGQTTDNIFEVFRNALIIYSPSMERPVHVTKPCSSYDILPTVLNLMGAEYDSRLLAGTDILSDSPALAMTNCNQSWISDYGKYNLANGKFTLFDENNPAPEDHVKTNRNILKKRIEYSQKIIINDYYKVLYQEIGLYK